MTNPNNEEGRFGYHDNSYIAAGSFNGIAKLVDDFYDHMERHDFSKKIFEMQPKDINESRRKLTYFLSGWLGGPKLYSKNYGGISIPGVHQHLAIGPEERDAWLECMRLAIDDQPYSPEFSVYLLTQLSVPANRVEVVCQRRTLR